MGIGERITIGRKQMGHSQQTLADRIGITRTSCSQWERGITAPSVEHLAEVACILKVNFEWLATGRGHRDYDYSRDGVKDEGLTKESYASYQQMEEIVELYTLLPTPLQKAVHALLRTQVESIRPKNSGE